MAGNISFTNTKRPIKANRLIGKTRA